MRSGTTRERGITGGLDTLGAGEIHGSAPSYFFTDFHDMYKNDIHRYVFLFSFFTSMTLYRTESAFL